MSVNVCVNVFLVLVYLAECNIHLNAKKGGFQSGKMIASVADAV